MSRSTGSLSMEIQAAVDKVLSQEAFVAFERYATGDGMSIRRYIRIGAITDSEISVYRDKWWSKDGGKVFAELCCLNHDYQRAVGGCDQSWLHPDLDLPLCHFQYRTGVRAENTEFQIGSEGDVERFAQWFARFLVDKALPWFGQFESTDGIETYLTGEGGYFALAKWLASSDRIDDGRRVFTQFLVGLPRQVEQQLAEAEDLGLIRPEDTKLLSSASIQQESVYRDRVEKWAASRVE